jgi:hypothetical protein
MIRSKIRLVPDADSPFLELDDMGNRHEYGLSGSVAPVDMGGSARSSASATPGITTETTDGEAVGTDRRQRAFGAAR